MNKKLTIGNLPIIFYNDWLSYNTYLVLTSVKEFTKN